MTCSSVELSLFKPEIEVGEVGYIEGLAVESTDGDSAEVDFGDADSAEVDFMDADSAEVEFMDADPT
jgi:hypothetical protein